MARREYSPETKAAAMAALLAGQGVPEIARTYKIPEATLRSWKSRQANGESVARVATDKKDEIGALLVDYLGANLRALRAQAEVFSDPAWIREQGAAELATLHGVMTDKAVRLIEAFGTTEDEADAD